MMQKNWENRLEKEAEETTEIFTCLGRREGI